MLTLKTNPTGIDWYIQKLQSRMHAELVAKWGLVDDTKYACYGRCDRTKTKDGYIAEIFTGGNEYKEVFWNDSLSAISFFGISGQIAAGSKTASNTADVHLVFFVDVKKLALKDSTGLLIGHRADEEVRQSVTQVIGRVSKGFTFQSIDLWLENVLREYPGTRRDQWLKYVDMQPVHCFRLNLKLIYNPNNICQSS